MAILKTIKITEDPILIGIQWSHSFAFSTSSQLNPIPVDLVLTPIDLALYNVRFALKQGSSAVTPTITKYSNGLATARLTANQTAAMGRGQYQGQLYLESIATLDTSFFVYVEVDVVGVVS